MKWKFLFLRGAVEDAAAGSPFPTRRPRAAAAMEPLEGRRLLSASVAGDAGTGAGVSPPASVVAGSGVKAYGVTVSLQAGQEFNNYLGDLTGVPNVVRGLRLGAVINWGDGSVAGAGVASVGKSGNIDVGGRHTYASAGTYSITISVSASPIPIPGQPTPAFIVFLGSIHSKALVSGPVGNSPGGVTIHETAGVPFTASVGTFPLPPLSIFNGLSATIDWGDGKQSAGQIANGVVGTHTYKAAGAYRIVTKVYIISVQPPNVPLTQPAHPPQLFRTLDSTAIVTAEK